MSSHKIVRTTSGIAAASLAVATAGLLWSSPARAGADIFDLSSEAVAVQSTFTDPAVPLGIPFSAGSYGASSLLNSNGESAADAGAPYSPLVSSLPSTGNGVAQSTFGAGLPVVPTFPGYVSAKDPVAPLTKQNAGGYELSASADPARSSGVVGIGGQSATAARNNAFAVANSMTTADGVFTEGAAGVHALTLDGILDIADFSSYASLTRGAGDPVAVTRTHLGTITFAGLTSGLTGEGFKALGSAPTPLSVDGLTALNEALKPAGVTLTYLPEAYSYADGSSSTGATRVAKKKITGVVSGALRIFLTNTSERGTTTETITIGRVAVKASSASTDAVGPATVDTRTGAVGTGFVGAGVGGGVGGVATDGADVPAAGPSATVPGAPVGGGTVADAAEVPAGAVAAEPGLPAVTFLPAGLSGAVGEGTTSFESFYLVLALAGLAALLAAQVVRLVTGSRT